MKCIVRTTVCIMLLASVVPAWPDELGRLFFTPEQRAQLERQQQQKDAAASERTLTVNGIVQKNGGGRTVWINGAPQTAGKSRDHTPDRLPVTVPGQAQPVEIKVGQKLLLTPTEP